MDTAPPPPDPHALLQQAGLAAKKSWGQNFLRDQQVLQSIAAVVEPTPEHPVVEIGAGLGALTYWLLRGGGQVIAIERDREVVPLLKQALAWAGDRLQVREENAAKLSYQALARELGPQLRMAGNLPYQISSRLLVNLADAAGCVAKAVVMVQKEVADRMCAAPGTRTYGLLSVLVQRRLQPRLVRVVAPGAFLPPPKVRSAVVSLVPRADAVAPEADRRLVAAARAAFSQRRKTLRNAVAGALGQPGQAVEAALAAGGIDPQARAETLALADFARLGDVLAAEGWLGSP